METSIDVRADFACFWGYSVVSGEIRILAYFGPNQIRDVAAEPHALNSPGQAWLLMESSWAVRELQSPCTW